MSFNLSTKQYYVRKYSEFCTFHWGPFHPLSKDWKINEEQQTYKDMMFLKKRQAKEGEERKKKKYIYKTLHEEQMVKWFNKILT